MGNAQPGGANAANPAGIPPESRQIPGNNNGGQGQYSGGGGFIPPSSQNNGIPFSAGGGVPPGAYPLNTPSGRHQPQPQSQQQQHVQHNNSNNNNYPITGGGADVGASEYRHFQPQQQQQYQQQQQQPYSSHMQHSQQQQQSYSSHLKKSSSDTSMTFMDGDPSSSSSMHQQQQQQHQQHPKNQLSHSASTPNAEVLDSLLMGDDTVPTVFRWEHGARQVYITGTFNGWSRQIPMHRSGNDFTYIHNLKRGKHAFKFIVDDEWRFAPDQPTVADIEGRINNFIDVTDFKAYRGDRDFEKEKAAADYGAPPVVVGHGPDDVDVLNKAAVAGGGGGPATGGAVGPGATGGTAGNNTGGGGVVAGPGGDVEGDLVTIKGGSGGSGNGDKKGKPDRDGEIYSHTMPDVDDYTKEPPPLPPHLRHIILNKPPQLQDTAALPVPQHVALNHLYCTAIKDNMMVLGITQRFKTKFVTTVYYSPCSSK